MHQIHELEPNCLWKKEEQTKSIVKEIIVRNERLKMASEADMEPTQTQSQSTEVDINSWKLNENDSEAWGKLFAVKEGIKDIGETNNNKN